MVQLVYKYGHMIERSIIQPHHPRMIVTMDSVPPVSCCLAAVVTLLIFCVSLKMYSRKKKTPLEPPEPEGGWPILGHLGLLSGTSTPLHRTLADLADRHGHIFALRLGQRRAVVVSSMDLAKECLSTNDRALAGRPKLVSSAIIGFERALFGLAPYGPYWRDMRKVSYVELLSSRRLDSLKHVRLEEIGWLVKGLYEKCGRDGQPVEMKRCLGLMNTNIIVRMVAGARYLDVDDGFSDGRGGEFLELMDEFFFLLGLFTMSDALPWLQKLDVGGHVKAMKRVRRKMEVYCDSWVAEVRRRKAAPPGGADGDHGFIGALLREVGDDKLLGHRDTETIVNGVVWGLIAGGTGTTSDTLVWTISLLLNNRHVLRKARDELDVYIGKERQVDDSDVIKLTYLQAIVKESMRLYPVAPLLVPHESIEPVRIGGYDVPLGTIVFINAWKIHRDPNLWPDADEFKPERFVTMEEDPVDLVFDQTLMTFGLGRRKCPGSLLAASVVHLTLARLIQGFQWSTPDDGPIDMTEGSSLGMPKRTALNVLLHPRLASHVYQ